MKKPRGLNLVLTIGQSFNINGVIDCTLTNVTGKQIKICIDAPGEFKVSRHDEFRSSVEEETIKEQIATTSRYLRQKDTRVGADFIPYCYGRYGGTRIKMTPTYFLRYVLSQELGKDNSNEATDKIISELERRREQNQDGDPENTLH